MSAVLIVEDEQHLADGLRFNLEAEGYTVKTVNDGEAALSLLVDEQQRYDALVLDVMLPGKDGFTVAAELRAAGYFVPVLMLTARGRPEDVLRGFESGADDYLPKPFNLSILIARVDSLLRRKNWSHNTNSVTADRPQADPNLPDIFQFDGKIVDFRNLQLRAGAKTVQLTVMETDLLRYLVKNAGHPVSRKAILQDVWNLHEETDSRAIDSFIVRLRKYIEPKPSKPRYF